MISILIVDDKPSRYASLIQEIIPKYVAQDSIDFRANLKDSIDALESKLYDLIVVDMMLPLNAWSAPDPAGGVNLLETIRTSTDIKRPQHIVGITAATNDDISVTSAFENNSWVLIREVSGDNSWASRLVNLISHLTATDQAEAELNYQKDICVVTALRTPEFQALQNLPLSWSEALPVDSNTYVYETSIQSGNDCLSVVAANCIRMGTTETALLCSKLIHRYRPRLLVMTGICAGVDGKVNIGDVVIANPSWDWQSCKVSKKPNEEAQVLPALDFIGVERELLSRLELLANDHTFLATVRSGWPGEVPSAALRIVSGPMASGSVLVADGETIKRVGDTQHRELLALEMEAYAVHAAARSSNKPRPSVLVLKSVCDFGNYLKDDKFQKYAAYTSASCFHEFIIRFGSDLKRLIR